MRRFAGLLDALLFQPARNAKLRLLADYFETVPDPDRGWGLAALTGSLDFRLAKPALIRQLASERVDPELFAWSYDFVGDLAETVALIWPERSPTDADPSLSEIVTALQRATKAEVPVLLAGWLDGLDATGRWALLKLLTGGLRVGVSARLAKTALAEHARTAWHRIDRPDPPDLAAIEEVWHGLEPPFAALFQWLDGQGAAPDPGHGAGFRPLMLANPIDEADLRQMDPSAFLAEWKWDGIRVQLVSRDGRHRVYSRSGDDISAAFPDIAEALDFDGVLDGELLVAELDPERPFSETGPFPMVASFNALQARLNRRTVGRAMLRERPAFVRAYDLLFEGGEDLRRLPVAERRLRLEAFASAGSPAPVGYLSGNPFW